MPDHLYIPCATLVGLTALVWARAVRDRVAEIRARRIPPQALATSADRARLLGDLRSMDNFNNLLELPVLFYLLCLALVLRGEATQGHGLAAWVFVALRFVHSFIHITYNRVTHRFAAWVLGALWLFGMWAAFALRLGGL